MEKNKQNVVNLLNIPDKIPDKVVFYEIVRCIFKFSAINEYIDNRHLKHKSTIIVKKKHYISHLSQFTIFYVHYTSQFYCKVTVLLAFYKRTHTISCHASSTNLILHLRARTITRVRRQADMFIYSIMYFSFI